MLNKLKKIFLLFSTIFFISSITCFTAYNWNHMTNIEKLGVPTCFFIVFILGWFIFDKELYKNLSLFISSFVIGTIFAVFGQIYQTGADSWTLFANWSFFLIIPTIISSFYPLYFLLISVLTTSLIFYQLLFVDYTFVWLYVALFISIIIVIYPFIILKFKLFFNNIFYNLLVSLFFIFLTFSTITNLFYYKSFIFLNCCYLLLLSFVYFLGYFIQKKIIIQAFSILYLGLFIWTLLVEVLTSKSYFLHNESAILFFIFLSLIIFILTLNLLKKSLSNNIETFLKKFYIVSTLFLKFIIFIFLLCFSMFFIVLITNNLNFCFFIVGSIFLILSLLIPSYLNFSQNKSEIITFLSGIILLNYYFTKTFAFNMTFLIILSFLFYIIYLSFLYFKPSKAFDFFFFPAIYLLIINIVSISSDSIRFYNLLSHTFLDYIVLLGCLIIILFLVFYEKIQKSLYKDRLNLIFNGNEFIVFIIVLIFHFFHQVPMLLNFFKVLLSFISLLAVIKGIQKENNLKITLILFGITLLLNFICLDFFELHFMVMFILLNLFKNNEIFIFFSFVFIIYFITKYYYDINSTLFDKSKIFLLMSMFFISNYFLITYFSNGDEQNE